MLRTGESGTQEMLQHMKQQVKRMICRLQHRKLYAHHRRPLTMRQKFRLMCEIGRAHV